jgi:RIO kinase 1
MRLPDALTSLIGDGIIEEVLRPLQSGKEAQVFIVRFEEKLCVAKVYKKSNDRSFKNRASYTEGRKVRNSRQQRAMEKKSSFGRDAIENEWYQSEYQMLHRLAGTELRIPECHFFIDNVLIMEFIQSYPGEPAPRLADITFTSADAEVTLLFLIRQVVIMLCEGVVHGDLSDFNILMDSEGPVIIDFPQAIDTAHNRNARRFLIRDVRNLTQFMGRFAPHLKRRKYGEEMWALYENGTLTPNTVLTGKYNPKEKEVDEDALIREIQAAAKEAAMQQEQHVSKYAKKAQRALKVAEAIEDDKKKKKAGKNRNRNRNRNRNNKNNSSGNSSKK